MDEFTKLSLIIAGGLLGSAVFCSFSRCFAGAIMDILLCRKRIMFLDDEEEHDENVQNKKELETIISN